HQIVTIDARSSARSRCIIWLRVETNADQLRSSRAASGAPERVTRAAPLSNMALSGAERSRNRRESEERQCRDRQHVPDEQMVILGGRAVDEDTQAGPRARR